MPFLGVPGVLAGQGPVEVPGGRRRALGGRGRGRFGGGEPWGANRQRRERLERGAEVALVEREHGVVRAPKVAENAWVVGVLVKSDGKKRGTLWRMDAVLAGKRIEVKPCTTGEQVLMEVETTEETRGGVLFSFRNVAGFA